LGRVLGCGCGLAAVESASGLVARSDTLLFDERSSHPLPPFAPVPRHPQNSTLSSVGLADQLIDNCFNRNLQFSKRNLDTARELHSLASKIREPDVATVLSVDELRSAAADARDPKARAHAQFKLGLCYAEGAGVVKSDADAATWFGLSAEAGFAPAQYRYGLCFDTGSGGMPASTAEAVKWYRRAVELVDPRTADALPAYLPDVVRGNISAIVVRSTPSARELSHLNHREAARGDGALSQLTSMIENLSVVSAEIAAARKLTGAARELAPHVPRAPHADAGAARDAANFVYSDFLLSERNRTVSVVVTNAGGAGARESVLCTARGGDALVGKNARSTKVLGAGQSEELVWSLEEWRDDGGRRLFFSDGYRPRSVVIEGDPPRETASVRVEISSLSQGARKFEGTLQILG
jgi:hypothetical protein